MNASSNDNRFNAFDAVVFFENGITPSGERINDIAFSTFPDEVTAYWHAHPDAKRRVGKVFLTEREGRPTWLIHVPVGEHWGDEPPLAEMQQQLQTLARRLRDLGVNKIGMLAANTAFLHGPELRGMLKAVFPQVPGTISILYDSVEA